MAVAQSSSSVVVIRYVLPVLWMTSFLPARRVLAIIACLCVCVCVCVCVYVRRWYVSKRLNVGSRKQHHVIAHWLLVFWRQVSLVDDPPFSLKLALSDPPPFGTSKFWPISVHSALTVRASEKSLISTNRKSTPRLRTSHRWTVYVTPKSPKGWHKTRLCYFFQ